MMSGGGFWFGHALWWILGAVVVVAVAYALVNALRDRGQAQHQSPLELLRRRYAAGELSTQEYEERKATLDRDMQSAKRGTSGV